MGKNMSFNLRDDGKKTFLSGYLISRIYQRSFSSILVSRKSREVFEISINNHYFMGKPLCRFRSPPSCTR